jgi:hypothetical protein
VADEQQAVGEAEATPETGSQAQTPTAEQVEAEYKARLSGKDKAHAAETATLRSQIAALEASQKDSTQRTATENDAIKTELENTKKQLVQTQRDALVTTRAARFPNAAEALEPDVLASMDEAKLAGLEARLAPASAGLPPLASSTPAKASTAPKPQSEKTVAELEADLRRFGPQFEQEIRRNM